MLNEKIFHLKKIVFWVFFPQFDKTENEKAGQNERCDGGKKCRPGKIIIKLNGYKLETETRVLIASTHGHVYQRVGRIYRYWL